MKKILSVFVVILIGVIIVILSDKNKEVNQIINKDLLLADSLMFIKPDSSLAILEGMKHKVFLDPQNNALQALLLVQARSRNYIKAENDSLIKVALDYYSVSTDSIRKAWTYLYASDVYEDMGEKNVALNYIQKAATTAKDSDNDRLLCYIFYNWGWILHGEKPYDEAINKMLESEKYARNMNDTTLIVIRLKDACQSCMFKKDNNRSLELINDAISLSERAKLYKYYPLLYLTKSHILLIKKQYKESLVYSSKAIDNIAYTDDSLKIYSFKARVLIKLNEIDSARYFIEKGRSNENYFTRANYQDLLSLLEEANGDYKSALKHRVEYAKLLDSIYIEKDNNRVMAFQKKYDFSAIKTENDKLKIDNQLKNIYLLIFIIVLLCVAFVVYFYISSARKKVGDTLVAKDKLMSQAINRVQKKNNELIMAQQQFQEKEFAMLSSLTNKDNELSELQQEQRNLKESIFKMDSVVKKIEAVNEITAKEKIRAFASLKLTDQDLESLIDSVNFCYDGFVDRLKDKYPDLSKEDLYLCCLLRMGVTNQNIITLLNTTDSTLKKRKYRLKNEKLSLAQELETIETYLESV